MKKYLIFGLIATAVLSSSMSLPASEVKEGGGGTPFIASGDMLQAIFQFQGIWRKVGGSVDQISTIGRSRVGTQFKLQTHEYVPIKNQNGVTVGGTSESCSFVVDVTYSGVTPQVSRVDFTECPAANRQ